MRALNGGAVGDIRDSHYLRAEALCRKGHLDDDGGLAGGAADEQNIARGEAAAIDGDARKLFVRLGASDRVPPRYLLRPLRS
jgi:hypothetical protein